MEVYRDLVLVRPLPKEADKKTEGGIFLPIGNAGLIAGELTKNFGLLSTGIVTHVGGLVKTVGVGNKVYWQDDEFAVTTEFEHEGETLFLFQEHSLEAVES